MDNFNCKQHLKCGEWEKNQPLLKYQKEALRMKQNKNAIENMQSKEKKPIVMKNSGGTKPMTIHRICNY